MKVKVYHDEKTNNFDEYVVIIGNSVFSMSVNALSPLGINQYCCSVDELDTDYLNKNCKEISFMDLPFQVREAVKLRMRDAVKSYAS
jgi:hypothetical protein